MMVINLLRINFAKLNKGYTMKNFFLTLLIVSATIFSFSQEVSPTTSKFQFGLKGGMNIGWINTVSNNLVSQSPKISFSYGVMGDYFFAENYALSAELTLSTYKGGIGLSDKQTFINDQLNNPKPSSENLILEYTTQYVELPISLKFRTKEIGYIRYWGQFGLSPGFLTASRVSLSGDVPEAIKAIKGYDSYRTNEAEGDPFTKNAFDDQVFIIRTGLIIGGGIQYALPGNVSLYSGIRYDNGFINMFLKHKESNAKNNAVSLSVGILF